MVCVLEGTVFDVAVDLRKGSPTFGHWHGEELSAKNARALYIPPGFAHGFCAISETVVFFYKCTAGYTPSAEGGILWSDPSLRIRWPSMSEPKRLSEKDLQWPLFQDIEASLDF